MNSLNERETAAVKSKLEPPMKNTLKIAMEGGLKLAYHFASGKQKDKGEFRDAVSM